MVTEHNNLNPGNKMNIDDTLTTLASYYRSNGFRATYLSGPDFDRVELGNGSGTLGTLRVIDGVVHASPALHRLNKPYSILARLEGAGFAVAKDS